ncbi:hypothetical protein BKA82DRAFT_4213569 [Pisolithus tinctorius]|nr:hypothetical protein BKA82DRAFT_4213569 [Pisolithus tinctorius]
MLYTALVGCVLVHTAEGASVIHARYIKGRVGLFSPRRKSGSDGGLTGGNRRTVVTAGVPALLTLTDFWMFSTEPGFVLSSVVRRYEVPLMDSWVYQS